MLVVPFGLSLSLCLAVNVTGGQEHTVGNIRLILSSCSVAIAVMNVDRKEPLVPQVIHAWYGLSRLVLCQAWVFLPCLPQLHAGWE